MLRIAICDDEKEVCTSIQNMTENLLKNKNIKYEITVYDNGYSLLDSIISFDIILLDIEMQGINGMEVAHKIRTYNNDTKIIFITNSTNYLIEGYTVHAERYFVKPVDPIEFNYELSDILKNEILDNKFILNDKIGPYKIYLKDIIYIEFYDRKTIVHKINGDIATYLSLKEWYSLLKEYNFSQSHKAYIINLRYVKKLKNDSVIMKNNIELPLSRKYKVTFRIDYFTLIGERV